MKATYLIFKNSSILSFFFLLIILTSFVVSFIVRRFEGYGQYIKRSENNNRTFKKIYKLPILVIIPFSMYLQTLLLRVLHSVLQVTVQEVKTYVPFALLSVMTFYILNQNLFYIIFLSTEWKTPISSSWLSRRNYKGHRIIEELAE